MTLPQIRAVVFDMDGLMFNTEDLYDQVGQTLLTRRGQNFDRDLKLKMMGLPGPRAFEVLKSETGIVDSIEVLQQESDEIFKDLLPNNIQTLTGLEELLAVIEEKKLPKAVATSSQRQFAEQAMGYFDLAPRFEFILTADDVANGKPAPDIYIAACEKLGVAVEETLVLEDSFHGTTAAVSAGTFTVAVPTRHSSHIDFGHVNYVAESLNDPFVLGLFQ